MNQGGRMKTLYMIGGTMGVGKTTACQMLKKQLGRSVFLDGDWCWDMHPFQVTEETKKMVLQNITFLLSSFLRCQAYENVIFCWVMHEQQIIDDLLARHPLAGCTVHTISLVCTEEVLSDRLKKDVAAGIRAEDVLLRSTERLGMYQSLHTKKIDVSALSPQQTAAQIIKIASEAASKAESNQN